MTRRDYVRIAAALRDARERAAYVAEHNGDARGPAFDNSAFGVQLAAEAIADMLAADNPRFDSDRFDRAVYGEAQA